MKTKPTNTTISIKDTEIDKDTVLFLGIWETFHNLQFNFGKFARIKSQRDAHSSNADAYRANGEAVGKSGQMRSQNGARTFPSAIQFPNAGWETRASLRETDKALKEILEKLGV